MTRSRVLVVAALLSLLLTTAACAGISEPRGDAVEPSGASVLSAAVAQPSAVPATTAADGPQAIKALLYNAAVKHRVNPGLVMGVAWWESGWNQSEVSSTGAVGIMQVEPATAASAGPLLLHRRANLNDPLDNIELGAAILRENLDRYHDNLANALVAYYAGPGAVTEWTNLDPATRRYVWGIYRLAIAFNQGTGPA